MPVWSTTLDDLRVDVVPTARGPVEVARAGHGPAVLLIHGIPGSWRQPMPLAEDLAPQFEVLLPSRPGYGATPLRVGRTYDEQADTYAALLDALRIERASIVGISGGGPSSVSFASRPDRCDVLVLVCALAPHLFRGPPRMRLLNLPLLPELAMPAVRALARRRIRRPKLVDAYMQRTLTADELQRAESEGMRADVVRHMLSHQAAPPGLAGLRNDAAQMRGAEWTATNVSCPTLVLHSDCDSVVPLRHAQFHAGAIPGAELRVLEQAGHLFMVTRRPEATDAVRAFLEQAALG
jgi:pimeloyl-ACP methyl ester carboxylesterase